MSKYSIADVIKSVIIKCIKKVLLFGIIIFIVGVIIFGNLATNRGIDLYEEFILGFKIICLIIFVITAIFGFKEEMSLRRYLNSLYYLVLIAENIESHEETIDFFKREEEFFYEQKSKDIELMVEAVENAKNNIFSFVDNVKTIK